MPYVFCIVLLFVLYTYRYFLLKLLEWQYDKKDIGLYMDNGFSILKNCSGLQIEKIKKRLQKLCRNNGLEVIIECNMKTKNHHLHKIFNTNSVKVSYSCTKSMKTIITTHNKNILGKKPSINKSNCNCPNNEACPLSG